MSIVISESTRTVLKSALRCDYSGKKRDKSKRGYYKRFVVKSESHGNFLAHSIRTSRDRIQFYDKKTQQH